MNSGHFLAALPNFLKSRNFRITYMPGWSPWAKLDSDQKLGGAKLDSVFSHEIFGGAKLDKCPYRPQISTYIYNFCTLWFSWLGAQAQILTFNFFILFKGIYESGPKLPHLSKIASP